MERQSNNSGSTGKGDGTRPNVGAKGGDITADIKSLQQDVKGLSAHLKEIKNVLKQLVKENNNKIPGIK